MCKIKQASIILLTFTLIYCNTSNKESVSGRKGKTTTIYLQVDTLPTYKYMIIKEDLTGKTLVRVGYSDTTGLIKYIEKWNYDSLQRLALITTTQFPDNAPPLGEVVI
jgi:hypothetical protein